MKILSVSAANFQSYPEIQFNYADQGLALVSGPTGAGKSTLLDLVSWTLFGVTSKEGKADEVMAWGSKNTSASLLVETPYGVFNVSRTRGAINDLFWIENGDPIRGKDLTETQKLLEARLGVTSDLFLTSSYLTQFSKAGEFFISKAKDRREVLEKIADQEFAVKLGERSSERRKVAKKDAEALEVKLSNLIGRLASLEDTLADIKLSSLGWKEAQFNKIQAIKKNDEKFEQTKEFTLNQYQVAYDAIELVFTVNEEQEFKQAVASLREEADACLKKKCGECGGPTGHKEREKNLKLIAELTSTLRDIEANRALKVSTYSKLMAYKDTPNPYTAQLEALQAETNPFEGKVAQYEAEANRKAQESTKVNSDLTAAKTLVSRLSYLYDASSTLRGLLMTRAVSALERQTNDYLTRFFDAAIRVQFALEDSDKIEVEIFNNGHTASFKALSGGERCMLKLCFSLSLMRQAQEKAGVAFGQIFLDEPFNGLDTELKGQAFALLQELSPSTPTVLVIEHDETIKNMFDKKFIVTKLDGHSSVLEE